MPGELAHGERIASCRPSATCRALYIPQSRQLRVKGWISAVVSRYGPARQRQPPVLRGPLAKAEQRVLVQRRGPSKAGLHPRFPGLRSQRMGCRPLLYRDHQLAHLVSWREQALTPRLVKEAIKQVEVLLSVAGLLKQAAKDVLHSTRH